MIYSIYLCSLNFTYCTSWKIQFLPIFSYIWYNWLKEYNYCKLIVFCKYAFLYMHFNIYIFVFCFQMLNMKTCSRYWAFRQNLKSLNTSNMLFHKKSWPDIFLNACLIQLHGWLHNDWRLMFHTIILSFHTNTTSPMLHTDLCFIHCHPPWPLVLTPVLCSQNVDL